MNRPMRMPVIFRSDDSGPDADVFRRFVARGQLAAERFREKLFVFGSAQKTPIFSLAMNSHGPRQIRRIVLCRPHNVGRHRRDSPCLLHSGGSHGNENASPFAPLFSHSSSRCCTRRGNIPARRRLEHGRSARLAPRVQSYGGQSSPFWRHVKRSDSGPVTRETHL